MSSAYEQERELHTILPQPQTPLVTLSTAIFVRLVPLGWTYQPQHEPVNFLLGGVHCHRMKSVIHNTDTRFTSKVAYLNGKSRPCNRRQKACRQIKKNKKTWQALLHCSQATMAVNFRLPGDYSFNRLSRYRSHVTVLRTWIPQPHMSVHSREIIQILSPQNSSCTSADHPVPFVNLLGGLVAMRQPRERETHGPLADLPVESYR